MMKYAKPALVVLILLAFLGCANQAIKSPDQMSPKERGAFALTLYNNAFTNYNAQFAATPKPFSVDMTNYFQGYKKVMEAAWPVISAYASLVNIGGVPTPDQEAQILQIMYQLQAILISKVG